MLVEPAVAVRQEERVWGMLGNLLGLLGYFGGIAQYVAPLAIYLFYRNQSKFIAFHALQSLYFQLMLLVIAVMYFALSILACGMPFVLLPVLGPAFAVAGAFYSIFAAIKAYDGEWFEYPIVGRWAARRVGVA